MIEEKDLRIDIFRNAAAVEVSRWALRITHMPTGLVAVAEGGSDDSQLEAKARLLAELEERLSSGRG